VTVQGLLSRYQSLGIREVEYDIFTHPERDSGCRTDAINYLRGFPKLYQFALVMFDYQGCGAETTPMGNLQTSIEQELAKNGWAYNRARVNILDPELEIWVWSDSAEVERALGWEGRDLRTWLVEQGLLVAGTVKPLDPKEAMYRALREVKKQHSAVIFERLAQQVSLKRCTDSSFQRFLEILRDWFA
jgi:hypothetical protein